MIGTARITSASVLILALQSCSSTGEVDFETMTEYELIRYNMTQSPSDNVVCFGPTRDFVAGRYQRTDRECFTVRELENFSILTRSSPHDTFTNLTGGFETDNSDF